MFYKLSIKLTKAKQLYILNLRKNIIKKTASLKAVFLQADTDYQPCVNIKMGGFPSLTCSGL